LTFILYLYYNSGHQRIRTQLTNAEDAKAIRDRSVWIGAYHRVGMQPAVVGAADHTYSRLHVQLMHATGGRTRRNYVDWMKDFCCPLQNE